MTRISLALAVMVASAWTAHASVAGDSVAGLESIQWQLASIAGEPLQLPANGRVASFTLAGGGLTGTTGCNSIRTVYAIDGQSISFATVLTTKKYCRAAWPTEQAFLGALREAQGYAIDGNTLMLTGSDGSVLAEFRPATD